MKKRAQHQCPTCGQTTTYELKLDHGSAHIVLALANAVNRLDRNHIHLGKDMVRDEKDFANYRDMVAGGWMTYKMEGNSSRPRFHGLIAAAEERGYFVLTRKGANFLRGIPVKKTALVSKTEHHQIGYVEEDGETTFLELLRDEPYWQIPTLEKYYPPEESQPTIF